jgi:hypothetical protein
MLKQLQHIVTKWLLKMLTKDKRALRVYRGSRGTAPPIPNDGTRWKWLVNFTPWPLYSRERTPVAIEHEAEWGPEPVWMFYRRGKSLSAIGIRTPSRPTPRPIDDIECGPASSGVWQDNLSSVVNKITSVRVPRKVPKLLVRRVT